jgi:N-acetylmuramic acid 6-phosphate etherase
MQDRSHLLTEQRLPESMNLDAMSIDDAVALMNAQDAAAVRRGGGGAGERGQAVELVAAALAAGGRLFYFGAGTSGRLGVLDAAECPPTFRTDPAMVQGVIAGGEAAMFRAQEGPKTAPKTAPAAVDAKSSRRKRRRHGHRRRRDDAFVHGALRRAAELGGRKRSSSPASSPCRRADGGRRHPPADRPEVVTGSTRLKAGTATKLVLNTISTLAMVRSARSTRI